MTDITDNNIDELIIHNIIILLMNVVYSHENNGY